MTAHISQHVTPRHRVHNHFSYRQSVTGAWHVRRRPGAITRRSERGSVTQSTITISFALVSLIGVMLLGFLYLQQVFGTAAQGTDIQQLEQGLVELREEQKKLELEGAQLRSIQSVEERVQDLNLVTSEEVAYLAPATGRVARAQ